MTIRNEQKAPMFAYPYIANGFGAYRGHRYSNTKQSYIHAIEAGYHFLKADMRLTTDGRLVCSSGWDEIACKRLGIEYDPAFLQMTYDAFMRWNLWGQGSVDAKGLADLMRSYPQSYVLLDFKTVPADQAKQMTEILLQEFDKEKALLARLLVQVNNKEICEAVRAVYTFQYMQFHMGNCQEEAAFEEKLTYAAEQNMVSVSLQKNCITEDMVRRVKERGLSLMLYSLDSKIKAQPYLAMGVDTICTNYIDLYLGQKATPKEDLNALYREFHKLPMEQKKIVFSNFHGKGFGCNPKYIALELLKRNREEKLGLDLVWFNDGKDTFPEGIRTVPYNSEQAIREMATARILVDNQMKFTGFLKRPDQFFIETWHGAIPLKKLGMDNLSNIISKSYCERMHNNFDAVDLLLSNSSFCTHMFRRAYAYEGYVLEKGCPRNDILTKDPALFKEDVCKMLGVDPDKKLMLYAPTFRADKSLKAYQMDYEKVAQAMGDDWVLLIRLHPHIQKLARNLSYNERVVNASTVPDMQVLMAATDILLTDYSNIMFEFMASGRPCFLYATDIEEYRKERDYYFDLEKLPFSIAQTTDELITHIHNFDEIKYREKVQAFSKEVGLNESGHAAEAATAIIVDMIKQPDYDLVRADVHKRWANEAHFYRRQREKIRKEYQRTGDKNVVYTKQAQYHENLEDMRDFAKKILGK